MEDRSHKYDCRVYMSLEMKEHLKAIAQEKGVSVNKLILDLITKKYPIHKPKRKSSTVPKQEPTPAEKENRLSEINQILKRSFFGILLTREELTALKQERDKLRSELDRK